MKKALNILMLLSLIPMLLGAQERSASLKLDRDKILIGEQITAELTVKGPTSENVSFPIVADTLIKFIEIVENFEVQQFIKETEKAVAVVGSDEIRADHFIVATGALTPFMNRHLGCKIPIEPGKGYSITMPRPKSCPSTPLILEEHRVAITPMKSAYRIGSTMEFVGYDESIKQT